MKKIIYAIAALALIFTGCAKELDYSTKDNFSKVRLHVKVADQMTKVSADNDGRYHWQAGDEITVLNSAGAANVFITAGGGSSVNFSTDSFDGDAIGNYAMYPASSHSASGNDITFNLPSSYTWKANSTNMPMLGKIEGNEATFKAVGGVLKLVCYNIPADAVRMEFSATNKQISGEFDADGTLPTPVITTAAKASSNNIVNFDFTGHRSDNMVFYIPLPTGVIGEFTIKFYSAAPTVLFTKTASASLEVSRNQMIIAPVLNCDSADDAMLTNAELVAKAAADSWSSYTSGSITNSYGTWAYNAAYQGNQGGDGKYYIQITSGRDPVSYIQLPSFSNNISQIILHSVCNASNAKFTGEIYFASKSAEPVTPIATAPTASVAKEDLTIEIPSGYSTGYLKASSACRIAAITVKFRSGACDEPSISPEDNPIIIAVSSGDVNSASTTVTYSTSLTDDLGVSIASHSDWITPTLTGTGPYTLTVSANKKVTAGDREDGFVTLRATGVNKTITVHQPSALVPNPVLTVVPGNETFTATWTKHSHASGYTIYLGDPENGGTDISADPGLSLSDDTYSLTKSVDNDDYSLYVKVIPAANYVGQSGYTKEDFTCSGGTYTITVTQPASGGSITVNGSSNTSIAAHAGDIITIAASEPSTGYKWGSWSVSNNVTTLSSTTATTATFTMPADNVSVTATFPAKAWTLVTGSSSSLQSGDQIILVNDDYNKAAKRNSEGNNMIYTVVGSSDSGATLSTIPNDAAIITLGTNSSKWTLSVDTGTYLYAAGGTGKSPKNQLKETSTIDQKSRWTIEFSSNNAIITCEGGATRNTIRYNSSNEIFSCYASDGQNPIRIYRFE